MNPHLLPKIRSEAIMAAAKGQNCSLRIASFVGKQCAGNDTTVGCHVGTIGKGMSTKCSDLFVAFGCSACHDIIDRRDIEAKSVILQNYPTAYGARLLSALCETQSILVWMGILNVIDGETV